MILVPEANLTRKPSAAEKKKKNRDASIRVNQQQNCGKTKSHTPKEITGNVEDLMKDVACWLPYQESQTPINWQAKAKQFSIRKESTDHSPPNAGQLLKEFLKSQGVDTAQFEQEPKGCILSNYFIK